MKTIEQAIRGQARMIPEAHFRGQPRLPQMQVTSMSLKRQTADSELRTKNWANALGKRISTAQPTVSSTARDVSIQLTQAHMAFLSMEKEARTDEANNALCRERAASCRRGGRST